MLTKLEFACIKLTDTSNNSQVKLEFYKLQSTILFVMLSKQQNYKIFTLKSKNFQEKYLYMLNTFCSKMKHFIRLYKENITLLHINFL